MRLTTKIVYVGHRDFLPMSHEWTTSKKFKWEEKEKITTSTIYKWRHLWTTEQLPHKRLGKHDKYKEDKSNKREQALEELNWSKKSIFMS